MAEQLAKIYTIFQQDQPLTLLFSKETYMTEKEKEERRRRINPIFEVFNGDKTFYPHWNIAFPKMVNINDNNNNNNNTLPTKFNLYIVIREIQGRGDSELEKLLEKLSLYLDLLRKKITSKEATENDYLIYIKIIDILSEKVKNNNIAFTYEIPPDNDGINPVNFSDSEIISSDEYHFEYINSLLSLLSYYNHHMINGETISQKIDYTQKAIDVLRLLHERCKNILDGNEKYDRCVYKRSCSSISSESKNNGKISGVPLQPQHQQTQPQRNIDIRLFITYYLGGLSSINARIYLLNAKFYELVYIVQTQLKNEYLDQLTDIIALIIGSYENAYKCAVEHNPLSKLTGYCRFMYHLWQCEGHYLIADNLSGDNDIKIRTEALQRLVFINELYQKYKSTVKTTFLIGDELREQRYRKVIQDTNTLYQKLNNELIELLIIPEKKEFIILEQNGTPYDQYHISVSSIMNELYKSVVSLKMGQLHTGLCEFTRIATDVITRSNDKPIITNKPVLQQRPQQHQQQQFTLFDQLDDVNSAKIGMLKERELWLNYFLGKYDHEQKAFIIDAQNYDVYKQELIRVKTMMTLHANEYK